MTGISIEYKGYSSIIEFDEGKYHGKIFNVSDLITYEADNLEALKPAFEAAVDDYIETIAGLNNPKVIILEIVREEIEKSNKNIAEYIDKYFTKEEAIKHSDNIQGYLLKSNSLILLIEMNLIVKGL